ncbi:MAG TPA: right-handed parallel beta-helix repeat-containing protein [Crinalium sp.]|jgi:hypothetical protein
MVKKVVRYVSAGLLLAPALSDPTLAQTSEPDSNSISPSDHAIASSPSSPHLTLSTPISPPESTPYIPHSQYPTPSIQHPTSTLAQDLQPTPLPPKDTPEPTTDLRISPRLGLGHTSSGSGYDGTTRFEGFLPLAQTPGSNITFLEGRLLLDNDANVGGNVLLGYRTYSPGARRTLGGYLAYDNRRTDDNTFNQLGLGLESLGERWDIRANAYLPIGDQRQEAGDGQLVDAFFRGRSLILSERNQFEAAVGGVDVETGTRLAKWGDRGDLRGYGGLYWYDSAGGSDGVGWRLRLEARPNDSFNVGLGVQNDALFGTNILFRVGINFPGSHPRGRIEPEGSVVARLGESVERNPVIVVDAQSEESEVVATNPDTGDAYVFQHVSAGATGGNGTFENPFGTVQPALNASLSDGNHIVYVQPGSNPGIPGFLIPDRVRVLSTAPVQLLTTAELGTVQLPLSGSGVQPILTGTVLMGNNSTLSGFAIAPTNGPGVIASVIDNAIIRDNSITSSTGPGIFLESTSGTITLLDNTVTATGAPALAGTTVNNVTVTGGSLRSTNSATNGIALDGISGTATIQDTEIAIASPLNNGIALSNVTGTVTLAPALGSTITNSSDAGVAIQTSPGTINLSNLEISGAGGDGINASDVGTVTVANMAIANVAGNGIQFTNVIGNTDINNTTVDNAGASGIVMDTVTGTSAINDNTVNSPATDGISLTNVSGTTTVNSNTISGAGRNGIAINTASGSTTIDSNNIIRPAQDGVNLANVTGNVTVSNNVITTPGQDGIELNNSTGQVNLNGSSNQVTNAGVNGMNLTLSGNASGTAIVTDSSISNSALRGISVDVSSNGALFRTRFESNEITDSTREGLGIYANGTSGVTTGIRFNRFDRNNISNLAPAGVSVVNNASPNVCAQLNDNSSTNSGAGYNLQQNVGNPLALSTEIGANNVGSVTTSSTIVTPVPSGTCDVP